MNLRTFISLSSITVMCIAQAACGGGGVGVSATSAAAAAAAAPPPPPPTYSISGTVANLAAGDQLVLLNNGGDPVIVTGNGAFTFATPVASNGSYVVTVDTQPIGQTCTVSNGSGAGITANVPSVSVICSTDTYNISGSIAGLGNGQVTLDNNGADAQTVTADGGFLFLTPVVFGGSYSITVSVQPPGQICTVSGGAGAGVTADVSSVAVTCSTDTFTIGGSVAGLAPGTQVTLFDNGADALTVTADRTFSFATPVALNGGYAVTVGTQPAGQVCTVSNGSGAAVTAGVNSVSITCSTDTRTIGGSVTGLAGGAQITLFDNGADALTVTANGQFTFATPVVRNASYAVTVSAQPTGQFCTVTNGSGAGISANVNSVAVSCSTATYTIGGSLVGLAGGAQVTLSDNGANALTLKTNGPFAFAAPVAFNRSYVVTVSTQPNGQVCTVSNGSGANLGANVSTVGVSCSTGTFTIGGTLAGLTAGNQVTLYDNGGDALKLAADGSFTFASPVAFNGSYAVTIGQAAGQICSVANGTGTNVSGDIATVNVVCNTPGLFTIGGTVAGLAPCDPLQLALSAGPQGGTAAIVSTLSIGGNGSFTMSTAIPTGDHYSVSPLVQPETQNCQISSDSGTVASANVTSVVVTCSPTFLLGGTISGLRPGGAIAITNGVNGDSIVLSANGSFDFAQRVSYDGSYRVTVTTPAAAPSVCIVNPATAAGTGVTQNITSLVVTCT